MLLTLFSPASLFDSTFCSGFASSSAGSTTTFQDRHTFTQRHDKMDEGRYRELREKMAALKSLYASHHYQQCAKFGELLLSEIHDQVGTIKTIPLYTCVLSSKDPRCNSITSIASECLSKRKTMTLDSISHYCTWTCKRP